MSLEERDGSGGAPAADVRRLEDLVAYEPGSVVSRTLVKKETGTVTLFAFDRNESLSEHTAPFDALVLVIDGEAEVRVAGVEHRVRAGETIDLPANRPHAVRGITKFKMLLIMIRS